MTTEPYENYWMHLYEPVQMRENPPDCVDGVLKILGRSGGEASDWGEVEVQLGAELPLDYKRIMDVCGPGEFCGLRIFAPGCGDAEHDLGRLIDVVHERYDQCVKELKPHVLAPFFPQRGGLLPWGVTKNGSIHCWNRISEDPSAWPVLFAAPDMGSWYLPECTFSCYLEQYLSPPYGEVRGMSPWGDAEPTGELFVPASSVTLSWPPGSR